MLHFFVSSGGASEGNLSNFCNILLQNAMKRCSRENGFVLTLNIAGSENFECKARRKILPKARSRAFYHFEQKSHLRVLDMEEKKHMFGGALSIQAQKHIRANRRSVRKLAFWRVKTRNYILLLSGSAACASEVNSSHSFTMLLENAMEIAHKEMFSTFFPHAIYDEYRSFSQVTFVKFFCQRRHK